MDLFRLSWQNILFAGLTALWLLEFRLFPSTAERGAGEGARSFRWILFSILAVIMLVVVSYFLQVGWIRGPARTYFQLFGLAVYGTGLVLRYWCSYLLGQYFTRGVTVDRDQDLVSSGPYRSLRHPLYLGLLLLTVGVPLFLGNVAGVVAASILMPMALANRIAIEERELLETLGERYATWMKGRYRMIPYIY